MGRKVKFVAAELNRLSLWQTRPGGWSCLDTSFASIQRRTTHALSTLASTNRQRTGDALAAVLDKPGYASSSMDIRQQNIGLWAARHSHKTELVGDKW